MGASTAPSKWPTRLSYQLRTSRTTTSDADADAARSRTASWKSRGSRYPTGHGTGAEGAEGAEASVSVPLGRRRRRRRRWRVAPSSLLPRRLGAAGGRLERHDLRDESHAEIVEEARNPARACSPGSSRAAARRGSRAHDASASIHRRSIPAWVPAAVPLMPSRPILSLPVTPLHPHVARSSVTSDAGSAMGTYA